MTKEQRGRLQWWWRIPLIGRLFAAVCLAVFPLLYTILLWYDNWSDAKYCAGTLLDVVKPNDRDGEK